MKTLILNLNKSLSENLFVANYADVQPAFRSTNILGRILRRPSFPNDFISFWLEDWKTQLDKYESIIVFDNQYSKFILKYISKKIRKDQSLIMWYWNPVSLTQKYYTPADIFPITKNIWTFDPEDSKKYGLKFNTTFFSHDVRLPQMNIEYDVYFIGKNKGRETVLNQLENDFKNQKISSNIIIISDDKNQQPKTNLISYQQNLENIAKSKVIIEILQKGQSGNSLRPLEAIFLKKKLITNNKFISNELFYDRDNIFILGDDSADDLLRFINTPFKEYPSEIIDYYTISSWLRRFREN